MIVAIVFLGRHCHHQTRRRGPVKIRGPQGKRSSRPASPQSPKRSRNMPRSARPSRSEQGAGVAALDQRCGFRSGRGDDRRPRAEVLNDADVDPGHRRARRRVRWWGEPGRDAARRARSGAPRRRHCGIPAAGLDPLAMERVPRITRAQSMDILSSQSNLAGYKAVVDAAAAYGRAIPMMMTAAGTISPTKVFVMGVGVAGLQAIATGRGLARRSARPTCLGHARADPCRSAQSRFSSRKWPASKARAPAAMPREMSAEYQAAQAELVSSHIAKQDIVITTALIRGGQRRG